VTRCGGLTLLIRVNFILGTPADPQPSLDSQIYAWDGGRLVEVATFPTCGGTDVTVLADADADADADGGTRTGTGTGTGTGTVELIVTNSLTPDLRFAAETVRYKLSAGAR
jgi:hypothetical protein